MIKIILVLILVVSSLFSGSIEVVTEEFKPYNYEQNNKIVGLSTEVVQKVLDKSGLKYNIKLYPWARAYKKALRKKNVLIYSIARTDARENKFKWVGTIAPYGGVSFFKLKQRGEIKINSLNDAKQYSMCSLKMDATTQFLTSKGFDIKITYSNDESIQDLVDEKVDIIPFSVAGFYEKIKQMGYAKDDFEEIYPIKGLSKDYYMAFSNNTDDIIVQHISTVLKKIKKDKSYGKILKKYGF